MSDVSPELNQVPLNKDRVRSGNNVDKPVKDRLKKAVGKVIVGTPLAALLMSSGTIDNPNIPAPNIKNLTPASLPLPENTSHNTDILQPYAPQPTTEIPPTLTPTPKASGQKKENKELIPYSPSITIVDIAPSVPKEGLIQKEFISNDEMIRNMLGEKYIPREQIIQEFGPNYEEKWDEVVEKYPQALIHRFSNTYLSHGESVARVTEHTLKRSGLQSTGINMFSLQKIFDKDSIKFITDSSGNPGISIYLDPERIIELLKDDPSRVINASFQVGNVELFQETKSKIEVVPKYDQNDPRFSGTGLGGELDGKEVLYQEAVGIIAKDGKSVYYDKEGKEITPITYEELEKRKLENSEVIEHKSTELLFEGAYTKAKAMENLPKLFEVCNAYPNKFFVFAGGNTGEDFHGAMEKLKDQIPNNLLITAEWIKYDYGFGQYEGPAMEYGKYGPVYGPDIYVYNEGSKHPHGSSFSVPELSAEIEILLNKGLSFEQAKEKILASSDIHTLVLAGGTKYTVKVFNPSKIQ